MATETRMRRFMLDMSKFFSEAPDSIVVTDYDEQECRFLKVAMMGPEDSPYRTATFSVTFKIPSEFPYKPPKANFDTPIWHANIGFSGAVCLNILNDWKPATTLLQIAEAVRSLLCFPNADSPLNADARDMIRSDQQNNGDVYNSTIIMWCCVFAEGSQPRPTTYQQKVDEVMASLQIEEGTALRRLSRTLWNVEDAVNMRRRN